MVPRLPPAVYAYPNRLWNLSGAVSMIRPHKSAGAAAATAAPGNHRYAWGLSRALGRRLRRRGQPYPKFTTRPVGL